MTETPREGGAVLAKVVVVGPPGAGKAAILQAVAAEHGPAPVRAADLGEGRVFRTKFAWRGGLPDGPLHVRLFAVSGSPSYNAVSELALASADGIVFAASLSRDHAAATRKALQAMVFNARQRDLNLAALPVALHFFDRADGAAMTVNEMHGVLGLAPGSVPCFLTGGGGVDGLGAAVQWVVAKIAERLETPREAIAP